MESRKLNRVLKEKEEKKKKKLKFFKKKEVNKEVNNENMNTAKPKVKNTKARFWIGIVCSAVVAIALVLLVVTYIRGVSLNGRLNLIPENYMSYISYGFIGAVVVLLVMLFFNIWKKTFSAIKIIIAVFMAVVIWGLGYANSILTSSVAVLDSLGTDTVETKAYSLVVLKDGKYKKIEDLSYKLLMYYDNEMGHTEEAMAKLREAIVMMTEKTTDVHELANKLINKSVDAILLEDVYYDLIEDEIPDFKDKITTLYAFNLEDKMPEVVKDVAVTEQPFNIYISGIDSRAAKMPARSRSDVNMVVSVNPKTKQILLVNIPRDYYVQLNGTKGYRDKLTHAGVYGVDKSIKTIEDLLDIDINYYVRVNFNSVVKIVDAIGGVEVDSQYAFTTKIGSYKIKKGINKLDGKKALAFARERYALPGGDTTRGKNQQAVIDAIIQKVTSTTILTKFDSILDSVKGSFQTNMSTDKMVELVRMQITDNAKWNVSSIALAGASSKERTYSMGKTLLYVMIPYAGNIKQANILIEKVLDGEMLEKGAISLTKYNDKLVVPKGVYKEEPKEEPKEEQPVTPETPTPEQGGNNTGNSGTTTPEQGGNQGSETPGTTPEQGGNQGSENPGTTTPEQGGNEGSENPGTTTPEQGGNEGSENPGTTTPEQGGNEGSENPGTTTPEQGGNEGSENPGTTTPEQGGDTGNTPETPKEEEKTPVTPDPPKEEEKQEPVVTPDPPKDENNTPPAQEQPADENEE